MHNTLRRWLEQYGIEFTHVTSLILVIGLIMVTAVIIHLLLHRVLLSRLEKRGQHSKMLWLKVITQHKLFHRVAFTLQGVIVNIQAVLWLHPGTDAGDALIICAQMWVMLYALLSFFSLLDTLLESHAQHVDCRAIAFTRYLPKPETGCSNHHWYFDDFTADRTVTAAAN